MAERPTAWVKIPTSDELLANAPSGRTAPVHPYDFDSFFPAMGRLIQAHGRIGPAFSRLFAEIMSALRGRWTVASARWWLRWPPLGRTATTERSPTQSFCVLKAATTIW